MPSRDELKRDAETTLHDVNRLRRELVEFSEINSIEQATRQAQLPHVDDLMEYKNRTEELLDRIYNILQQIGNSELRGSAEGTAFSLSTLANELHAQLEWLRGILEHIENMIIADSHAVPEWFVKQVTDPVRSALRKIKSYIVPLLKKFLSKVWQIISGLLTPKEWKLQGKVGTGLLGLADVGIEITFGT